jgi:hypothetical protein
MDPDPQHQLAVSNETGIYNQRVLAEFLIHALFRAAGDTNAIVQEKPSTSEPKAGQDMAAPW